MYGNTGTTSSPSSGRHPAEDRTDPRSSIIDALSTMVVNGTQLKLYAWYDNEWGYANRTAELARMVGGEPVGRG